MSPNWYLGRTAQLYAKDESTYGTAPTLAATDAVRHLNVNLHYDAKGFTPSPERHTDPSQRVLLTRRAKANFSLKTQMYPSGALNTLPELGAILKNLFGAAAQNITLSTTVSSGAATTGAVVASATGLVIGQAVQVGVLGGSNPGTYIRWLTNVTGTTLVWAPALPATCAVSDTVKGCITWTPATALVASMDIAHYPQAPSASTPTRELVGCVMDKGVFSFDGNSEPMFTVSGPAKSSSAAQSQPGGFTTVGAESAIPSGLTGYFNWNGTLYQIEKMEVTIDNAMELQNTALGTAAAAAYFRKGKRKVTVKINAKVSDDTTIYADMLTQTTRPAHIQIGTTSASIWGLYVPNLVPMMQPDFPDGDETNNWDFQGTALSPSAANAEVYLGMC